MKFQPARIYAIITSIMQFFFFILIGIAGLLTITTDVIDRKIRNLHLLVIASAAILGQCIFILKGVLPFSFVLLLNPLVSLIIGFAFYTVNFWKAGDAKLFFTYSLLLPANYYAAILPLSCFTHLIVAFLLGFLFLLPLSLGVIIKNREKIINKVISKKTLIYFPKILLITTGLSAIIQPALKILPINNIFLQFVILFTGYSLVQMLLSRLKTKGVATGVLIVAILGRGLVTRQSLTIHGALLYLRTILLYSGIFYILTNIVGIKEEKPLRIPFSPLLFLGALLTNSGFLWWVMRLSTGNLSDALLVR